MTKNGDSRVLVERTDAGVATVWFADAEVNNAWSPELEQDYYSLLRRLDADRSVRAIVVTGQGRHFCPGAAPDQIQSVVERGPQVGNRLSPTQVMALDTPIIAAVNGGCAGMGLLQALLCDVRFVSPDTTFAAAFTRRGLAGEHGVTWILPRVVGLSRAMDLLVSGRRVSGDEALAIGLATHQSPAGSLLNDARKYAHDIATNCSPVSTALVRHQVWADLDRSWGDSMLWSEKSMNTAWEVGDLEEGLASLREKRTANFDHLPAEIDAGAAAGHRVSHSPYRALDFCDS